MENGEELEGLYHKVKKRRLWRTFLEWKLIFQSHTFYRKTLFVKMEDAFYKWLYIRRKQRALRSLKKASIFYAHSLLSYGLKKFSEYRMQSRVLLKKERIKRRVSSYYNQHLLRKVFQKLKDFSQLAIKSKLLENEHQMRRNKIQSFITNFKNSKEPSNHITNSNPSSHLALSPPRSSLSTSPEEDYPSPPSYLSINSSSPRDPSPLKPLNVVPQPQPMTSRPRSTMRSNSSHSVSQSIKGNHPPRQVTTTQPNLRRNCSQGSNTQRPLSANRATLTCRDSPRASSSVLPHERIDPSSRTRSHSTSIQPPKPQHSRSGVNCDDQLSTSERRDKMKQLEQAAKARIQSKKQQEDEAKRRKEREEEEKYRQEIETIRTQYANQKRFSNSSLKNSNREFQLEAEKKIMHKAIAFYRSNLLINYGFAPWNRMVQERRDDWEKAVRYHEDSLLSQSWQSFVSYVMNIRKERYRLEIRQSTAAITFYKRKLIRVVWMKWKSYRKILRAKALAVQGQILKYGREKKAFRAWQFSLERIRRKQTSVQTAMTRQINLSLLRRCLKRWRTYISEQEFEREIESRVDMTWAKIQDWLI